MGGAHEASMDLYPRPESPFVYRFQLQLGSAEDLDKNGAEKLQQDLFQALGPYLHGRRMSAVLKADFAGVSPTVFPPKKSGR